MPTAFSLTTLLLCLALLSSCSARAADGGIPPEGYARVNAALLDNHVLPRYERLVEATDALARTSKDFCAKPVDSGIAESRQRMFDLPLPERGHSFAVHPGRPTIVHFSRRPGRFALVIDVGRGTVVRRIHTPADRHFYGHGVFSPDGRLLYASENDFDVGRGVIGVYDAADAYRRAGELPSHGIGPHEIRLLSDGETLVVANGGIATHPDMPRVKLNLPTMSPSLVYVDRRAGRLLEEVRLDPELRLLSIRHIAVGRGGTVAFAMQYQGPAGDHVPLIGMHRRGGGISMVDAPAGVLREMHQYCGGVAFDCSGRHFAVSSPRGGVVTFWDAATGALLSAFDAPDVCGVAPAGTPGVFLASSGRGAVSAIEAGTGSAWSVDTGMRAAGHWDNHLMAVPASAA